MQFPPEIFAFEVPESLKNVNKAEINVNESKKIIKKTINLPVAIGEKGVLAREIIKKRKNIIIN